MTTIYLDTSVINFLYADDVPELKKVTHDLFEFIESGVYQAYVSNVVTEELNKTSNHEKRNQLLSLLEDYLLEFADVSNLSAIEDLAALYINLGIIPAKKDADAMRIAVTVINKIDYLVSWNYQHLANVNRERRIIAVNYEQNYLHPLRILTPLELMGVQE